MSFKCLFHPYQTRGLKKGRTFSTVLFHFAELPMHLPQKSLTFPTMPLPSQLPGSSKVGILTPLCLGQPSQQVLQQGKVIPVLSHFLGTMQGSSAFKDFCPGHSCGSPGAFQVVSSALSPSSPLHCILMHLHILTSAHLM